MTDQSSTAIAEWEREHPDLCPNCGWSRSAHGNSHGFQSDCPWGVSPSAEAGTLPDNGSSEVPR